MVVANSAANRGVANFSTCSRLPSCSVLTGRAPNRPLRISARSSLQDKRETGAAASSSSSSSSSSNTTSTSSVNSQTASSPPASSAASPADEAEEVTRKWGLEAGLWKAGSNAEVAKDLLTRYGGAYLGTSIALSLVSFSLCYLLVDQGVDVAGLLDSLGLHVDSTGEAVGTFAIAYAAHKALSPVRFPPTVALTPVVAGWLGKNKEKEGESKGE
ncbi:unnamed protein product [Closterium sp. NIES-53]